MDIMISPPQGLLHILRTLSENGFEAFAVGGCIRDLLMGREPGDWDIATSASPPDVKALFAKTADTGLKHGTVTVTLEDGPYEVTTFRTDGSYSDGRRPDSVRFTGKLEDDLHRRDFTINAIAWNPEKGLIDPFGGITDIAARRIKAVGDPDARFAEDALRMLRAVRFAAKLDFDIEPATLEAIGRNCGLINKVSKERIRDELTGIITADDPRKFMVLRRTGLMKLILPEIEECFATPQNNPYHVFDVGEHSINAMAAIESDACLRWAMLLHDAGKAVTRTTDEKGVDHFYGHGAKSVEIAETIMRRLKFDNRSKEKILRLVRYHDMEIPAWPQDVAKAANRVGDDIFADLLKVKRADKSAQSPAERSKGPEHIKAVENIYMELVSRNSCFTLKDLAIDGDDLIGLGFGEGKEIGRVLALLLDKVLEDQSLNKKETLLMLAARMKENLRWRDGQPGQ